MVTKQKDTVKTHNRNQKIKNKNTKINMKIDFRDPDEELYTRWKQETEIYNRQNHLTHIGGWSHAGDQNIQIYPLQEPRRKEYILLDIMDKEPKIRKKKQEENYI